MAKKIELTVAEAAKRPECFMYIWATKQFLGAIEPKYAKRIAEKQANQKKVLMLSADKYLGGFDKVTQYYNAIKKSFEEMYGMTPYAALIVLAQGGTVAGKNWSEGVYGVGAVISFLGAPKVHDQTVTVDPTTGHIYAGTEDITDTQDGLVYGEVNKKTVLYQVFSKSFDGLVFCSQYVSITKKYKALSWSQNETTYSAKSGSEITGADGASIWGNINFDWSWIQNILNWILSIFGIQPINILGDDTSPDLLSKDNTLPNQKNEGFVVQESGLGATGVILLTAAAAGYLLFGKRGKKKITAN